MIIGLGTDIVEVDRIQKMIADHGAHFLERVFTAGEIAHCQPRRESAPHYAGRWAAKEAVMKVLGTGFTNEVGWTEIEAERPTGDRITRFHPGGRPPSRHRRNPGQHFPHRELCDRDRNWPDSTNLGLMTIHL